MNFLPSRCSVLIVGAGPSGLMMAAQLLRYGLQPVVIDSKTALTTQSRALVVRARSLEIFRQLGIDQLAIQQGNIIEGVALHHDLDDVAHFAIQSPDTDNSPFPYVLILEQSKTERLLLNYVTSHACPVYWNTELVEVRAEDEGVTVKIRRHSDEETIHCDWLIGADGASSLVRRSLEIPFSGGTYLNQFYLADIYMPSSRDLKSGIVALRDEGFTAILPMKDALYRFIGVLPETLKGRASVSFDDIKPYLTYTLGFSLQESECKWFSVYQLHHRIAGRFRSRRCFLIGDAAHIHSPVGGQGMNTGLQDAYNLAWKLSGVVHNEFDERILDTYSSERMNVARKLLRTTDRLFTLAVVTHPILRKIRNWLLPRVLHYLWKGENISSRVFRMISQTGVEYRNSSLSVHHGSLIKVRAGDRLPFLKLYDEKLQADTDLHLWCSKTGFTLLVIGYLGQRDLYLLARWIKSAYPFNLNFYYLPPSERNQHVFDYFQMQEKSKKSIIVRPDMYIGYMNDVVDIELIDGYLKQTVGWKNTF